jgi:anti-sigma-K factor RskA
VAAELALGTLAGDERADAIAHLAGCVDCRVLVEQLSEVADSLLLLAPEADPPLGFETRVAARLGLGSARRWRRVALAAIAAAVIAAVLGVVGVRLADDDGGQPLRSGPLVTAAGRHVGQVFAYDGDQSWVFMTVETSGDGDGYMCVLELAGGRHQELGWFGT